MVCWLGVLERETERVKEGGISSLEIWFCPQGRRGLSSLCSAECSSGLAILEREREERESWHWPQIEKKRKRSP